MINRPAVAETAANHAEAHALAENDTQHAYERSAQKPVVRVAAALPKAGKGKVLAGDLYQHGDDSQKKKDRKP